MILLARIWTYGLLVIYFLSYAMAGCQWRIGPGHYDYRNCFPNNKLYAVECTSTVDYDLVHCEDGEQVYDYDIEVILEQPDENPFLQNVAFYTDLTIQDGYLVTMPENLYNMTKLNNLKITNNKIRKLNFNNFLPLQQLKRINLANNKIIVIETIEKSSNYSDVQEIDVSFNFIETVPNNFVKRFTELEHLNMSHNLISNIDRHAFEGTVQLKTLDLSHNRLQEVGNIFDQLPRLYDLDNAASKNLQKLSKLVLDNNYIVSINFTEVFDTGIPELSIGGNKVPCYELAAVKYSPLSEKFDRIVTANVLNFYSENINGISCQNENVNAINLSDNLKSNSSILVSLLKNAIENNSRSVSLLVEIVNQNQKRIEQLIGSSNSLLSNINDQLTDIKNNLPAKPKAEIVTVEPSRPSFIQQIVSNDYDN